MSKPDWSEAPEWATVMLQHIHDRNLYAFAEDYKDGAKFQRTDEIGLTCGSLATCMWSLWEWRLSGGAGIWDGEKIVRVGDEVAFKYTPEDPWEITHIGTGQVCYTNGIVEYSATHSLFKATVVPYRKNYYRIKKVLEAIEEEFGVGVPHDVLEDFLVDNGLLS